MDFSRYTITENDSGRRLDRVLRKLLPSLPLSAVYKLLRRGAIRLDGKKAEPATPCPLFSVIEVERRIAKEGLKAPQAVGTSNASPRPAKDSKAEGFIKKITLLETPDLLFLNKPQGIAVHGDSSLCSLLPLCEGEAASLSFRAGPLHRLDKNTTGLIAFSKTLEGARWFSKAMRERKIHKLYAGILETRGKALRGGLWTDALEIAGKGDKTMETQVFSVASASGFALAVFSLKTGRKRQIRRQAAMRGMPLLGDAQFGGSRHSGGYFLHAGLMAFPQERLEGVPSQLEAPFPDRFLQAAESIFGKGALDGIFQKVYSSI